MPESRGEPEEERDRRRPDRELAGSARRRQKEDCQGIDCEIILLFLLYSVSRNFA